MQFGKSSVVGVGSASDASRWPPKSKDNSTTWKLSKAEVKSYTKVVAGRIRAMCRHVHVGMKKEKVPSWIEKLGLSSGGDEGEEVEEEGEEEAGEEGEEDGEENAEEEEGEGDEEEEAEKDTTTISPTTEAVKTNSLKTAGKTPQPKAEPKAVRKKGEISKTKVGSGGDATDEYIFGWSS
jgi:hypothetical protein